MHNNQRRRKRRLDGLNYYAIRAVKLRALISKRFSQLIFANEINLKHISRYLNMFT